MKKKIVRGISLILFIALVGSLFVGCGSSEKSKGADEKTANAEKGPVTLKVMNYIITQDSEKNFRDLTDLFNQTHPNINVDLEMLPWANYTDKVTTTVAAGIIPDSSSFKCAWYPTFKEHLLPIDDYFNNWKNKEDVEEYLINLYKKIPGDNKLYFFPYNTQTLFVYYRKDLFKEAGITDTPETWDEFLADAQKLTKDKDGDGKIDQYGFSMRANANGQEGWYCVAFSNMKKPSFYDESGKVSFQSPEVIEANQFFLDLFKKYKVTPPTSPSDGTNENISYLTTGKAAMMIQHIQQAVNIKKALGDNVGAFKIPTGKNGKRFVAAGENNFVIYKESKHKDETFTFISWLLEPEQHKKMVAVGDTAVFLKSLEEEVTKNDEFQAISLDSRSDVEFAPASPYMAQWATKDWPSIISKGLLTDTSSADIMKELEEKLFPEN